MNNERLNNEQKAAVQGKESDLYINKTVNKHISNSENNIVIKNSDKIEKIKEKMTESCGSNISPIRRSENQKVKMNYCLSRKYSFQNSNSYKSRQYFWFLLLG